MSGTETTAIRCVIPNCSRYLRVPVGSTADKAGKKEHWTKQYSGWHCAVHSQSLRAPEGQR